MFRERTQAIAAWLMIGSFLIPAALRLFGLSPVLRPKPILMPLVHAVDLCVFAILLLLALRMVRTNRPLRFAWALVLALTQLILFAFDLSLFLSIWFEHRILPLSTVPAFYCNDDGIIGCARLYPSAFGLIGLLVLAWAALLSFGAIRLAAWTSGWRLFWPGWFATIWLAIWLAGPIPIKSYEPVRNFLVSDGAGKYPLQLATIPRPDWQFAATKGAKPRLLILITIDALRADAVETSHDRPSNTPFLRELADSGKLTNYGPAAAMCSSSYCGLIGVLSSSDWATLQQGPPATLPDVLAANGYQSHLMLTGSHQRAQNLADLYGPNVTTLRDDISPDSSGTFDDREQLQRLRMLKLGDPKRTFLFFHLMSVHSAGLRFDKSDQLSEVSWWDRFWKGDSATNHYPQYYARGVTQVDSVLRELFGILEAKGLLNDALVIITADHGEGLYRYNGHGAEVNPETSLVPLLVYDGRGAKWPIATGMPSNIDAAPSLLTAAGIAVPSQWRGSPLQRGVTRLAAPSDDQNGSALIGRVEGQVLMARCWRQGGQRDALLGGDAALAAFANWTKAGLLRRTDVKPCLHLY
jgi:hypothetical protein